MKLLTTAAALCFAVAAGPACAGAPTDKDAVAMVGRGVALIKAKGKDEMVRRINARDKDFVQGELVLDMRDLQTGIVLAHPVNPAIVGKDVIDSLDSSGRQYRRDIVHLGQSKGKGWVDYHYKHPGSGKIEPKTAYIERIDDVILEAGIYKNHAN